MSAWISVKDRLPEPCVLVLITGRPNRPFDWFVGRQIYFAKSTFRACGEREWTGEDFSVRGVVTHWMPLPELP